MTNPNCNHPFERITLSIDESYKICLRCGATVEYVSEFTVLDTESNERIAITNDYEFSFDIGDLYKKNNPTRKYYIDHHTYYKTVRNRE